jgi:hypothetical protein
MPPATAVLGTLASTGRPDRVRFRHRNGVLEHGTVKIVHRLRLRKGDQSESADPLERVGGEDHPVLLGFDVARGQQGAHAAT